MIHLLTLAVALLLTNRVKAHGYLSQPAATFANGINTTYNTRISASIDPAFEGKKWGDNPVANTAMFTAAFNNSQFKTLRAMVDSVVPGCGNTVLTGKRTDVTSLHTMKWQNDQYKEGFVDSHHGPCEAWVGDKLVAQSTDCVVYYPGYPAEIPAAYSYCKGNCTFAFYWLALHEPKWQIFKQCTPISFSRNEKASATPAWSLTPMAASVNATTSMPTPTAANSDASSANSSSSTSSASTSATMQSSPTRTHASTPTTASLDTSQSSDDSNLSEEPGTVTTSFGSDSSYYDDLIIAGSNVSMSAMTSTTSASNQAESTDDADSLSEVRKLLWVFTYKPGDMFPNATATTRACPVEY